MTNKKEKRSPPRRRNESQRGGDQMIKTGSYACDDTDMAEQKMKTAAPVVQDRSLRPLRKSVCEPKHWLPSSGPSAAVTFRRQRRLPGFRLRLKGRLLSR